MKFIQ